MALFCGAQQAQQQLRFSVFLFFIFSTFLFFFFFFDSLCPLLLYQPAEPAAAPASKAWATGSKPDVAVSAPGPAPAAAAAAKAPAPAAVPIAGRRLLAPATKKAAEELRVDDPKIDEGVIAPDAASADVATAEASGARNGFALRPPGSPDVSAAEVTAVAAAASAAAASASAAAASAPSSSASASAANAKPLLQARVNSALVSRGNGDAAPLYEVRSGDTNAREPQAAADADVGLDYVRPGDAEGKTVLTSPKKLEAEAAAATAAAAAAPAKATPAVEPATPFDPLASTPGLQLSIPSSEAGTAWAADKPNDNTITASFDASSPGYLVGGGSGDSGVAVCAGRGLALVAAGGAVSVFTAEGIRKAGPTPLSAFFRGVEKPSSFSSTSSSSSNDNKVLPTGSWSSARCVYDASSSTPEAERQFYLAALYTPAPPSSAEDASSSSSSSSSSSQLIVAVTAEGDPTKTWAGPFLVNADGLVGQGNGTSTSGTMMTPTPPAPQSLPGLGRCAPAGCVAKDLALGIDAHALWATFDLFTSSSPPSSSPASPEDGTNGNAAAASRAGASALGLSRAQLRTGAANKRPTTVALSNFPSWTRALTPATTSPRAKHDSRAGGTQYLVAVSGGAGSGAAAKSAAASPLVVDDGDASKGTFIAAWSVTGTGTLVDGCKDGSPLASTETTYVTKSAAPVAAFFGGGGGGGGEAKKETQKNTDRDASKVSSSSSTTSAAAVARAPRTLGGAADVSSTRRVGSVTLANGATTGSRKLWVALSTPVRVGSGGESEGETAGEKKTTTETPPVLGASLLAFEIAPNSVDQASIPASENDGQQQRAKPSLVVSTAALLALPSASVVAPAAALARGNGTLVGVSFVTVAADLPPSLAYATFTPAAGVSSVRLLSKGVSPLSAFVAPSATFPSVSSFASVPAAPGDPRAAPAPGASPLQRLTTALPKSQQQKQPPLPMPRYSGATTDAEGGWWFAGQVTGCESSAGGSSGSSVGSAATSSAAKAASTSSSSAPPCKPVTVYTVARVKAVALE